MVCLDTSVLVALLRKEEKALGRLRTEATRGTRISTTPLNLCELYRGGYASRQRDAELDKVMRLLQVLEVLPLDEAASRRYGQLANLPALKREPIGDFDLIIACIALTHDEPLVTRDLEHFMRVPGLVVEAW